MATMLETIDQRVNATIAIRGQAVPEALPRILGLIAQRGLIPHQFGWRRDGDRLCVDLQVETDAHVLDLLVAKLDALVLVERAWIVASTPAPPLPEQP
jgi:acetolactate synthase regulatory subunit